MGRLQRHRTTDKRDMRRQTVQGTLQYPNVGRDLVGKELQHLLRNWRAQLLDLRLEDAEPKLVGGGVNIRNQPPSETRTHALLDPLQVRRALVRRDDDLAVVIDQRVESVEELFLGGVAP